MSTRNSNPLLIIAFLLAIGVPFAATVVGVRSPDIGGNVEARTNEPMWKIKEEGNGKSLPLKTKAALRATKGFVKRLDRYYAATFPFRNDLLQFYTKTVISVFRANPLPGKVVQGTNGWYFLGEDYSNEISESKALLNFSPPQLEVIADSLERRAAWLAAHGVGYYFCIVPNKTTIYGDSLPIMRGNKATCTDQLVSRLGDRVKVIDLRMELMRSSNDAPKLYFKTDSHWCDLGAYIAYQDVIRTLRMQYPQLPKAIELSRIHTENEISDKLDLVKQLALSVPESTPRFIVIDAASKRVANQLVSYSATVSPTQFERRYTSSGGQLKLLMFHDSFGVRQEQFLSESFRESVFLWDHKFNKNVITREKPDVVIHMIVERNLDAIAEK